MSNNSGSTEHGSTSSSVKVVIAVVILFCAILFIYLFTKGSTTTTRDPKYEGSTEITSIFCSGSGITNDIYRVGDPISTTQEVTALFHDKKLYDLTLAFTAQYDSNNAAVAAEAKMHANFNIYLGTSTVFDDHFGVDSDKAIANIHADYDEITYSNAAALLMEQVDDTEESHTTKSIPATPEEIKSIYTAKGFYCEKEK